MMTHRTSMIHIPQRGFTLLIALVLTSVVLAVGVALLDIAYKQILLASSARQSQYAFYNADSALECTLYYDQKISAFYYNESQNIPLICDGRAVTNYAESQTSSVRTTVFSLTCPGGGISANVTVLKEPSGSTNIYANGFSSCDATNNARVERGVKVRY